MEAKDLLQRVYDATNSGLDIITDLLTGIDDEVINRKKAFRLRPEERTPSAHLYPPRDGCDCWHVKDYGMGEGGDNGGTASYSVVKEITASEEINGGDFASTNSDENAIAVSGAVTATLANINVTKTGDSDGGDNTSFYGTNSAIIAKDGANVTITGATITTNATGANGVDDLWKLLRVHHPNEYLQVIFE